MIFVVVAIVSGMGLVLLRGLLVKPKFSPEYRAHVTPKNPVWRELRKETFALTGGRDVLLPFLKARELDHLRYWRNGQPIFGREIPIVDVVPLAHGTHVAVTILRRAGFKRPVNALIGASYTFWFRFIPLMSRLAIVVAVFAALYAVALALQAVGVVHGVPALRLPNVFGAVVHNFHVLEMRIRAGVTLPVIR